MARLNQYDFFFYVQRMLIVSSFADISCEELMKVNADINSEQTSHFLV